MSPQEEGGAVRLPNFVVIGAAKSGTTSLFHYLRQHPDVFLPVRKELHYFSYEHMKQLTGGPGDRHVLKHVCSSRAEYERFYADAKAEIAIGEVSPSYFYFSSVRKGIQEQLANPKIVLLLRDPVQKAFSQYMHLVRDNREKLEFYEALMEEPKRATAGWAGMWRYAESSLYADRLKQYLESFGDRMTIILFDDLVRSPEAVLEDLWSFLEVPAFIVDTARIFNPSGKPRSKLLADLLAKPNPLTGTARKLLPEELRTRAKASLQKLNVGKKGELDRRSRAYLTDFFASDVREVEAILGKKLQWLQ